MGRIYSSLAMLSKLLNIDAALFGASALGWSGSGGHRTCASLAWALQTAWTSQSPAAEAAGVLGGSLSV